MVNQAPIEAWNTRHTPSERPSESPNRAALIEYVSSLRQHQIDPDVRDQLLNSIMSLTPASGRPSEAAVAWTEEERHAIAHVRHQVEQASPEKPDCCFDFDLVKDLLRVIDRSIPHGDAVRAQETRFQTDKDREYAIGVLNDLEVDHKINPQWTALITQWFCKARVETVRRALSTTLASERVSDQKE